MKKQIAKILVIAVGLMGIASGAQAGNATILPGSMCKATNHSNAQYILLNAGGVRNINSSTKTVICPVPRMEISKDLDMFRLNGKHNSSNNTTARFHSRSYSGAAGANVSKTTSTSTGTWQLDWSDSNLPSNTYYYYYVAVDLDYYTDLYRIRYSETE